MSFELKIERRESGWCWELTSDGVPVQGGMGYETEDAAREASFVPHEPHPADTEIEDDPEGAPWATS